MRKSNLVARLAIVIMIAFAGIIVFLTTLVKNNGIKLRCETSKISVGKLTCYSPIFKHQQTIDLYRF